ncbi:hypothetical protein [Larkinella soli]|uniref:hypothetical protein n=1 Tax=Larkinella soli TaxID=1770527 RepID=UPI000FFCA7BA|nr:hypothetical protein [Larkinella soli]
MHSLPITRRFLKNPLIGVAILLVGVAFFEALTWLFSFEKKMAIMQSFGGAGSYFGILMRGAVLPEIVTLLIVLMLINLVHQGLALRSVRLTPGGIGLYELTFLPVLLLAFPVFNPFTQTVRYLLVEFPDYDFNAFYTTHLVETFTWRIYFLYLLPVLIYGYGALNISLVKDLLSARAGGRTTVA